MIELIPAIDLMDGKCVRLSKGDFNTKIIYSSDPVEMATRFEDQGFSRLHLVDLDGAEGRSVMHLKVLEKIAVKTGLLTDFGGGVQSLSDVNSIFNAGAAMVCIGSMAVRNQEEFDMVLSRFGPQRVILAADTRNEEIVISGWKESAGTSVFDFIGSATGKGITTILCTDVEKDGMLGGTSVQLYERIMELFPGLHLIASGGVGGIGDIEKLAESSIPAVVFGKAYFEGKLKIEELRQFL